MRLRCIRQSKPGVTLTTLYHVDSRRIGEMVALPMAKGDTAHLCRTEPPFCTGAALDDPYVSRRPLVFEPASFGGVSLTVPDGVEVTIDGEPVMGTVALSGKQLDGGVVLSLSDRVMLLVERTVRAPCAPKALGMIGVSKQTALLRSAIVKLASQPQPVLLHGQSGTGKELAARALHDAGDRADGPFVSVNLAAIPAATAASQLFGHSRGAFTGADATSGGFFGRAEGGTLFLDEIGEASLGLQAMLLRALESGEIQPIGGEPRIANVRIVTATNADLDGLVKSDSFRVALFHRLVNGSVHLAPLSARRADVALQLVRALEEMLPDDRLVPDPTEQDPWLSHTLVTELLDLDWPGNTRQLRAFARHLVNEYCDAPRAELDDRWRAMLTASPSTSAARQVDEAPSPWRPDSDLDGPAIRTALRDNGYRVERAAKALGIAKNTLYREMKKAGLPVAKDLTASQIDAARVTVGDDIERMAAYLEVSVAGLRRRLKP